MKPGQRTGFLLQSAHWSARRMFNEALAPLEIEARHFGVLNVLANTESVSQKRLVEVLELDKSSVVLIMDDLERLGLAERRPNERDRRAHAVRITQRGRDCVKKANAIAQRLDRTIFASFTREDRARLDSALWRVITNCAPDLKK